MRVGPITASVPTNLTVDLVGRADDRQLLERHDHGSRRRCRCARPRRGCSRRAAASAASCARTGRTACAASPCRCRSPAPPAGCARRLTTTCSVASAMASVPACTAACIRAAISPRRASTSCLQALAHRVERQSGVVAVEVVAGLDQLGLRMVARGHDDAVLHVAVGRDQDHQHAPLAQAQELDVVEHAGLPRRGDDADEVRQARQQMRGVGDHALRLVGAATGRVRPTSPAARARDRACARSAWCRRRVDSHAPSARGRRWCAGWRSGPDPPGRPSRCGSSPGDSSSPRGRDSVREPTGWPSAM